MHKPASWKITMAFATVYVLWSSTYLAIKIGVETLPPLVMAGMRMLTAGGLLYGWLRWRGTPKPERRQWKPAAIIGGLILLGGNGTVCCVERFVPSGLTALLVGTVPLWMVLLDWLWHGAARPTGRIVTGLVLGSTGAALLVVPGKFGGGGRVSTLGELALLLAAISWATGALYSRRANLPKSTLLSAAMQMLAGGCLLMIASGAVGEWRGLAWTNISLRSGLAVGYLVVFGSMVGYSAYMWLLQVSTPARVATTTYANPILAVLIGWLVAGEPLTGRILVAAVIIVLAVVLIISQPPPVVVAAMSEPV